VLVKVTVPPTLIVVTAVPLVSSFHLLPGAVLTIAVVGAVEAGAAAEAAGVAAGAGAVVVEEALVCLSGSLEHEVRLRNKTVVRVSATSLNIETFLL
jgi:hypothetical protein